MLRLVVTLTLGVAACAALAGAITLVPRLAAHESARNPPSADAGRVYRIGPGHAYRTPSAVSRLVRDGDTVEVEAGQYPGDVATWTTNRLTLRAVGGRVVLSAAGASAEGKAIWVIRGNNVVVDGFDFRDARVPARNGAGIRFETGSLTIRDCSFTNNEMGLLTSNDGEAELVVEGSEFAHNGAEGRHNHNLYVGSIRKLTVSGSYFHHARIGHLLKTRAAESRILFNRLTDETGGTASYELEFPDGGVAIVIGNVIQQGAGTDNPAIVSFGAEGVKWSVNELHLVGNTLIDDSTAGGSFVVVKGPASRVTAANNLLLGRGSFVQVAGGEYRNNLRVQAQAFVDASRFDYRLPVHSPLLGRAEALMSQRGPDVPPTREYWHPRRIRTLAPAMSQSPGAMQTPGASH